MVAAPDAQQPGAAEPASLWWPPGAPASPDQTPNSGARNATLEDAIRDKVRTQVLWHERRKTMEKFSVSPHTLGRFLERGGMVRSLPWAVTKTIGENPDTIEAAARAMTAVRQIQRRAAVKKRPPAETLEDA